MMTTKMDLWFLIDEVHRDYDLGRLGYAEAMIYLNAYAKVAAAGPEKSRQDLTDRIEKVRKWITDQDKEGHQ